MAKISDHFIRRRIIANRFHRRNGWSYGFYKRTTRNGCEVIPRKFDRYRILPNIKQQEGGRCATYAAVTCLEARLRLKMGLENPTAVLPELSIQQCLDGTKSHYTSEVLEWLRKEGVGTQEEYGYIGPPLDSEKEFKGKRYKIQRFEKMNDYHSIVKEIKKNGPVVGCYNTRTSHNDTSCLRRRGDILWRDEVVREDGSPQRRRHAVVVTGYKRSRRGTKCWIILNSWGEKWGKTGTGTLEAKDVKIYVPHV